MKKQNFANNLKNLREKNNLTQSKLATILNISRQAVYSYEQGKANPSIDILEKLTEIFNCSLDSLVFSETTLNTSKYTNINNLLESDYSLFSPLEVLNNTKKSLLQKRLLIDETIKDIDNAILKLNNIECSKELHPNIDSFSLNNHSSIESNSKISNSIDIDFYTKNKVKVINISHNKFSNTTSLQLFGSVACGDLSYSSCSLIDNFYIDEKLGYNDDDYFILQVNGESMNKLYKNGDYLLIKKTPHMDSKKKPYVFMFDDQYTLKFIEINEDNLKLIPHSTEYHTEKTLSFDELKYMNSCIAGTVEGVLNFID